MEEIKETVEVEAGITLKPSQPEPVSGSGVQEPARPEKAGQTLDSDASAQMSGAPSGQPEQQAPALRVINPASEADRGMTAASAQTAAAVTPSAAQAAPAAGGMTDEELARKALQAARKAGSHKGGRR